MECFYKSKSGPMFFVDISLTRRKIKYKLKIKDKIYKLTTSSKKHHKNEFQRFRWGSIKFDTHFLQKSLAV